MTSANGTRTTRSSRKTWKCLRKMSDTAGRALEVVPLPMPAPVVFKGQRVPASYANFYISNRTVLVPTFDDPNDLKALNTIQRVLPQQASCPSTAAT